MCDSGARAWGSGYITARGVWGVDRVCVCVGGGGVQGLSIEIYISPLRVHVYDYNDCWHWGDGYFTSITSPAVWSASGWTEWTIGWLSSAALMNVGQSCSSAVLELC